MAFQRAFTIAWYFKDRRYSLYYFGGSCFIPGILCFHGHTAPGPESCMPSAAARKRLRVAGILIFRYRVLAFSLCGAIAGLAGALVASRVGSANTTAGQGYFLQSYAAVFIGCTVSKSGVPCVVGTLIGAAVLAVLANGLTILQMPSFMQNIITGGIIILAVVIQKIGAGQDIEDFRG